MQLIHESQFYSAAVIKNFFSFLTQWSWATIFPAVHTNVHDKIKWDGNSTVVAADTFKVAEAHTWRTTKTLNKMFFFLCDTNCKHAGDSF